MILAADHQETMEMEAPQSQARLALTSFNGSSRLPEPKSSSTSFPRH